MSDVSIDSLSMKITTDANSAINTIKALKEQLMGVSDAMNKTPKSNPLRDIANMKASKATTGFWDTWQTKAVASIAVIKRLSRVVGGFITDSNAYVENLNLFQVAMGDYFDEAFKYANKVQDIMGIDASQWIRNQGIFQTLATGFGVSSDKASIMSKNMTQLGYDLSSFFNLPFDQALTKLQSGLAGELEPLRRLGYDLSVARLQQEAYTLGIDKSVSSMTQAEKVQLRYYAIMTQVTTAQGDLTRTLENPSNQMRIFASNAQILSRTLGNIFIPVLNAILPYAIAVAKALRLVAEGIANFMGFKLPEIDYSGVNMGLENAATSADDLSSNLGSAKNNAKALKNYVMGIDELNIIAPPVETPSGGSGSGGVGGGGSAIDVPLPEYDFLGGLTDKANDLVAKMKDMLYWVGLIGGSLSALLWGKNFMRGLEDIPKSLANILKAIASVAILALEAIVVFKMDEKYTKTNNLKYLLGDVLATGVGSYLMYMMWKGKGAIIGLAVSAVATLTSISSSIKAGAKADSFAQGMLTLITGLKLGVAGMMWQKMTGGSMLYGAILGVSVGVAAALTINNFSAVASGQAKVTDMNTILKGLIATGLSGVAGALLISGPAGWAIGLGIGLAVTIGSLAIAADKAATKKVIDDFTAGMTTDLQYLQDMLTAKFSQISIEMKPMVDSVEKVKGLKESISTTTTEAMILGTQLQVMGETTVSTFEDLKTKIGSLLDDTKSLIKEQMNATFIALAGMTESELIALGYTESEVANILGGYYNQVLTDIDTIQASIDGLDKNSATYFSDLGGELKKLSEYTASSSESFTQYGTNIDEMVKKLNIEDPEAVTKFLKDIVTSANTAAADVKTGYGNIISQIDSAMATMKSKGMTNDPAYSAMAGLRNSTVGQMDADLREIAETTQFAVDSVTGTLGAQFKKGMTVAEVKEIQKNLIVPIGDSITTGLKDLDKDLKVDNTVKSFGDNLTNNIFDTKHEKVSPNASHVVTTLKDNWLGIINNSVKDLDTKKFKNTLQGAMTGAFSLIDTTDTSTTVSNKTTDAFNGSAAGGKYTASAYNSAINMTVFDTMNAINTASMSSTIGTKTTAGINGAQIGALSPFSKGVQTSVSNNMPGTAFFDTLKTGFGVGLTSSLNNTKIGGLTKMGTAAKSAVIAALKLLPGGGIIAGAFAGIPGFAEGGFPTQGQLFLANESGPEMVGSMGNRTTVANTGQIVQGISAGVAQANQEEVALLREQNSLLQRLLAKDMTVNLDGREVNKQLDNSRQLQGAPIISYG